MYSAVSPPGRGKILGVMGVGTQTCSKPKIKNLKCGHISIPEGNHRGSVMRQSHPENGDSG